jgi:hypothetical protein
MRLKLASKEARRGASVQHYVELETELVREEGWDPEEDTTGDFQCADSLAIAVNRIGGEGFGVRKIRKILLRSFSALNRTDGRPTPTRFLSTR